jgi:alkyl sulfatase BDS1-like metallo-beta-lactamase superfamily hydrolase
VGHAFTINWKIAGTEEACHSELTNAVLVSRDGTDVDAGLTITLPRHMLSKFALDQIAIDAILGPNVVMEGDVNLLTELASLLDTFPAWFPIATHDLKPGEIST